MNETTAAALNTLNQRFYSDFGGSFSNTRHQAQPGVQKLCSQIPTDATLLDIGCGNGTFAAALAAVGFRGSFIGIDFSEELLNDARKRELPFPAAFRNVDIFTQNNLTSVGQTFDVVSCFAVLHHIPGNPARERVLRFAYDHLAAGGLFILSNWQFLNSPKLRARLIPWSAAGLREEDIDPGDHLLDWKSGGTGLRYAHHFDQPELSELAALNGFSVENAFLSDGKSGDLGLYNIWRKLNIDG